MDLILLNPLVQPMCAANVIGSVAEYLTRIKVPLFDTGVPAGFASPALDYRAKQIDLNEELINDKDATFLVEVVGDSMIGAHIPDKSILVVDKSLIPESGSIVVARLNDGYTVKYYVVRKGKIFLVAANPKYPDIEINESHNFRIWGVVTRVLTKPPNLFR